MIPYFKPKQLKKKPFGAAHNYTAYIRDYPPPPGRKTRCRLLVSLLTQARLINPNCGDFSPLCVVMLYAKMGWPACPRRDLGSSNRDKPIEVPQMLTSHRQPSRSFEGFRSKLKTHDPEAKFRIKIIQISFIVNH